MLKQNSFLTEQQIKVIKMRKQGLTQREIAEELRTTRVNISILERRAYENISRAKVTLEILNRLEIPSIITVLPDTIITDIPRIIIDKADDLGVKIKGSCLDILEMVRKNAGKKIKGDHVRTAIIIEIIPDGTFYLK